MHITHNDGFEMVVGVFVWIFVFEYRYKVEIWIPYFCMELRFAGFGFL